MMNPTTISSLCLTAITALLLKAVNSQDISSTYLHGNCSDGSQFEQGSEYQTNLYYLLSNLTSNSDTQKFYNFTTGSNQDRVYGLFLCNSVVENQICQRCIQSAANEILQRCPSSVEAILWYSLCMLRYANRSIFAINDVSKYYHYTYGPTEYSRFNQQLSNTFISLFGVASAQCLSLASATTVGILENDITMNPSVDCTPDLSPSDCRSCLQIGLSRFQTEGQQLVLVLQPSCRLMNVFLDTSVLLPAEPNKKLYIGMGVISAIAAISMVFIGILICCLKRRKATKKLAAFPYKQDTAIVSSGSYGIPVEDFITELSPR
ncbi:hypothetical protein BVRB_8g186980 [Beta vulgaris subsp. vulgaris]|nr:hypothetical protein BVRB_8g186980 [Beta vulgaris subsp. vulgaris]